MVSALLGKTPIGLDVGRRWIHAAQLQRKGRRWSLAAWASWGRLRPDAPLDAEEVQLLANVLDRRGFKGDEIVSAVEGDAVVSGIVETPSASSAPRYEIARRELARMHELSPQQLELNWWELPRNVHAKNTTQVMAAGVPHDRAEAYLDVFEQGRLEIRALDVRSCALARGLSEVIEAGDVIEGFLDIDWQWATLYITYQGVIVYERRIERAGWSKLYQAIAKKTEFDDETISLLLGQVDLGTKHSYNGPERRKSRGQGEIEHQLSVYLEEVVSDLKVPFTYVQHEYSRAQMGRLLLCGQASLLEGFDARLQAKLELPVLAVRPGQLVSIPPQHAQADNRALTAALGYARFQED